jgi:predicted dehydrogenase
MQCAERGLDIFVEKPLSHTTKGLTKLMKLTKLKKLTTMVGSNWKFYPLFQKMKELLGSGAIGKLLSARCQFGFYLPDWHPWEDYRKGYSANKKLGGGILLDSHEFDYLLWFVGSPVKQIACIAEKVSDLEIDVEDTAEVLLRFDNGVIGEMHLDYIQRFYQRNFEFFGTEGTIIWDTNWKKVVLSAKSATGGSGGKTAIEEFPLEDGYDLNTMYIEEIKHFLACVKERKETIAPFSHGARVVELIMAAKKSSEKREAVSV